MESSFPEDCPSKWLALEKEKKKKNQGVGIQFSESDQTSVYLPSGVFGKLVVEEWSRRKESQRERQRERQRQRTRTWKRYGCTTVNCYNLQTEKHREKRR